MKTKPLLLLAFACCFVLFINESLSRRAGAPAGRAGDPPAALSCLNGCHNSFELNSGSGTASIFSNIPETGYQPDSTYTITAKISQSNITRFGFQVLAFGTETNDAVGTTTLIDDTRTRLMPSGSKAYITHTRDGTDSTNSNTWQFAWTAPSEGTGQVVFYGAFVAANANNNNQGDFVYTTSDTTLEGGVTSIEPEVVANHRIYSVPQEQKIRVQIEIEEFTYLNISVFNINGQGYFEEYKELFFGSYDKQVDISSWSAGVYIVSVETNKGRFFEKVIVR